MCGYAGNKAQPRTGWGASDRSTCDQPRVAFAAHGGYSIPHTHNKIKPFLRKNPKRFDFVRKKTKKVQNLTQKPAKRGMTDYPLFPPIVSVRFAHLPASQKDGGNVEQYAPAGRTVAVPRKLQRRRTCDREGAGAGGGHPTPKQGNFLAINRAGNSESKA